MAGCKVALGLWGFRVLGRVRVCAIIAAFAAATTVEAQATPTVPVNASVYRHIDALGAAGLIDSLIAGQRPYSQREVVRLLHEAQRNLDRRAGYNTWAERVIETDLLIYDTGDRRRSTGDGGKTRTAPSVAEWVRVDGLYLDSPFRVVRPDSNGGVDAAINPLVAYREGRVVYDGGTAALESRHTAEPEKHVALFVQPRAIAASQRAGAGSTSAVRIQSGALNFLFGNLSIETGRDAVVFGQAPSGGLLLSSNAPPLDMIRLSTDRPAKLPWIFGLLGPLRGTAFIADLGPRQNFPHAKLIGYKLSGLVHPQFELGAQLVDEMGGRGSPPGLFRDRLYDLMPLIDIFKSSDYQFSNKLAGIDFRWRLPRAAGFELFADGAVDDLDARRWKSTLLEDAGYIAGFSFSCVLECGLLGVRAEYHQTGIRYYTHAQFTSGIAQNGTLLGDPLGPRGLGAYLSVDYSDARYGTLGVGGSFEARSGNVYGAASTGPEDRGFHFVLFERNPSEKRARALVSWRPMQRVHSVTMSATVGVERVHNFNFVAGRDRTNVLAQVGVEMRP
jgi:hypothetical protein